MKATHIPATSPYQAQSNFLLENGYRATTEFSYYGDMLTRLDAPSGSYWHCSNGHSGKDSKSTLPDFAQGWIEPIAPGHWQTIVRPRFTVEWGTK